MMTFHTWARWTLLLVFVGTWLKDTVVLFYDYDGDWADRRSDLIDATAWSLWTALGICAMYMG